MAMGGGAKKANPPFWGVDEGVHVPAIVRFREYKILTHSIQAGKKKKTTGARRMGGFPLRRIGGFPGLPTCVG